MKIGFDMSYTIPLSLYREGITVLNRFLFDSMLAVQSDLTIEFWCYERNRDEMRQAYKTIFDKYPKRVSLLTEVRYIGLKPWKLISISKILRRAFRLLFAVLMFRKNNILWKLKEELKHEFFVIRRELKPHVKGSEADINFISISPHILNSEIIFNGPVLFFIHDLYSITLRDIFRKTDICIDESVARAISDLERHAARDAFFTCYSNYIRDTQLMNWIPSLKKERIQALKIPPILKKIKDFKISEEEFRNKFNIRGHYTSFASLIRRNKNIMLLLKAMKILKDSGIDIKLVTTGTFAGSHEEQSFILANDLYENIIETGVLSEVELFALYKYSSLMVVTTRAEGPGIAQQCLEALNVGNIPVIHTKADGIEEALKQRGLSLKTADLNWVDHNDENTLVEKIRDVLANPSEHIEKQKNIISCFSSPSWDDIAQEFIDIMEKEIARYADKSKKDETMEFA